MTQHELISFALEAAIATQLMVLTVSLLSRPRKAAPALYLLAGITGSVGFMMATNFLIGDGGWRHLSDVNLFLELLLPPTIYLYVSQFRRSPHPLTSTDLYHAAPAIIGILAWETGLTGSMDLYVVFCWFAYLTASFAVVFRNAEGVEPASLRRFLTIFLGVVSLIGVFRVAIVLDLPQVGSFRDGIPYLLLLAVLLLTTCKLLFIALKDPSLLSTLGSSIKYARAGANVYDLEDLGARLLAFLNSEKPYLDPNLSLAELAARLDAPSRHVSQLINTRFGMNFSAYMNYCRVQIASQKLTARESAERPIKSIMYESGFKSKSIFNREFQRHFGVSPSEFRSR